MSNRSDEKTNEPLLANDRNYYKVEKWTKDGTKVDRNATVFNAVTRNAALPYFLASRLLSRE
jgi:hypothetical protein